MVKSCCAYGCKARWKKGLSFFVFPKKESRRKQWTIALRRENWQPSKHTCICWKHFQTGRPSSDPKHPDYIPNVFTYKNPVRKSRKQSRKEVKIDPKNVIREKNQIENKPISSELFSTCNIEELSEIKKVLKMRSEIEKLTAETVNAREDNENFDSETTESAWEGLGEQEEDEYFSLKLELYEAYTDINTLKKEKDAVLKVLSVSEAQQKILEYSVSEKETELSKLKVELQQAYEEINVLRSEKDAMRKEIASADISNRMLQDAKELHFYTGVHSTKDFHSILALIHDVDTCVKIFPMTTQLLIVLMKLRLNLLYSDLAFRFETSRNTVQRICVRIIPCLEKKLEQLIKCPVTNALKKTLPPAYLKNTVFENLYHRIQRFVKSEEKQCENDEEADFESM